MVLFLTLVQQDLQSLYVKRLILTVMLQTIVLLLVFLLLRKKWINTFLGTDTKYIQKKKL